MSNYTPETDFADKDSLPSGSPGKVIRGVEFSEEFNLVALAVNSKANTDNPVFTGTVTIENLVFTGTLETGVIDGGTY